MTTNIINRILKNKKKEENKRKIEFFYPKHALLLHVIGSNFGEQVLKKNV